MEEQKLKQLAQPLLAWYDIHRRILPWREEVSPYRTWVSEIMLQQTRVAAVLPYFQRFMEAFPTVEALAQADTERLMKLWEGLGYYSRARNLQKAARILTEQYGGRFPETYRELTALPGIGDYTAGAILSIAFGQAVPAVDGNVLRLAARITGSRLDVLDAKNRKIFRSWMAAAMSQERPGAYNQALMDLGATVCLPSGAPLCGDCPAGDFCIARQEGCQARLPVRSPKREKRTEHLTVFLLRGGAAAAPGYGTAGGAVGVPPCTGYADGGGSRPAAANVGGKPHQVDKKAVSPAYIHSRSLGNDGLCGGGGRPWTGRLALGGGTAAGAAGHPLRLREIYRRAERGRMTWHSYTSNTGRWAPARPPTP